MTRAEEIILKAFDINAVDMYWPIDGDQRASKFRSEISGRLQLFPAGSTIAYEGQSISCVICVLDGWLGLSKTLEDGQTQIIDFALPGDISLPTSADGLTSLYDIIAQTPARLAIFSIADWDKMEHEIPGLRKMVGSLEAGAHARLSERFLRMGKGNASMRIAYAMLEFFVRLKPLGAMKAAPFHIPLNQPQLGDFSGVSSVHVCRTLRRFSRSGILTTKGHMDITINDLVALAEIAEVSIPQLMISSAPQWRH